MNFTDFFARATGGHEPYPYQAKLAEAAHMPTLLEIPTGAGKTEAAIVGWLYRRFRHPDQMVCDSTPSRLVYCLPMRTLVEQTVDRVKDWLLKMEMTNDVGLVTLMGGETRTQWYLEPELPYIIVGTQDMLLSRSLNRGYGSSPFMWPVEYGLLNNDCLWVMDEVQLMANGLPTSIQLAGLRCKLGVYGPSHTMWMSATVKPDWLGTIDHPAPVASQVMELGPEDRANPNLSNRYNARKIVSEKSVATGTKYARNLASLIARKHVPGTLTLAIINTVERAQMTYEALKKTPRRGKPLTDAGTVLVHSRFRSADRQRKHKLMTKPENHSGPGLIVVATQAVEAGIDISARTLITELAPWPSMVQRFGRCNRAGEFDQGGTIFWVDPGERKQDTIPYDPDDVGQARSQMKALQGQSAGPVDIEQLEDVIDDIVHNTVIRKRDVISLFDTTPDLSGSYLDVSQYVRGTDERDVSVFWRNLKNSEPNATEPKPQHSETVSVPLGKSIENYLKMDGKRRFWRWDFLDDSWQSVRPGQIYPGMTLMLDAARGGYSTDIGWHPSTKTPVKVPEDGVDGEIEDGQSLDPNSTSQGKWVTLADHSFNVEVEVNSILRSVSQWFTQPEVEEAASLVALYHDVGKAHCAFQEMLNKGIPEGKASYDLDVPMAKSPGNGRNSRRHFRHEVGSALAVLAHADNLTERSRNLAAYLVASHHGKVRLGIRSLPGRRTGALDSNPDPHCLLGYPVTNPETLPAVALGEKFCIPETELDLSIARIGLGDHGRRSWLDRTLELLNWLGPFRLAYLEAIIRAADMRASKKEREAAQ